MTTTPRMRESMSPAPLLPVATGLPAPLNECPAELYDGWVMHHASLRNGLNTLLFPGQALMAYAGEDPTAGMAFAHGVSNATWLSSATLLQDKRIRRDVLAAAGFLMPRGRAFSLKRGRTYARQFADSLGYPVVVKPMVGESTVEVMANLGNEAELDQAIDYLGVVPTNRTTFTTASYAFTQILTPRTSSSTRTRGTYRYLVEEQVKGQYVRLLIAEGELLSAVYAPHGPWRLGVGIKEITDDVHADLENFAYKVWEASPGLPVLAVDVVVDDYASSLHGSRQPVVVEHSERPWMHVQHAANARSVRDLGQQLLHFAAARTGTGLAAPISTDKTATTFRWEGLSQVDQDVQAAEATASRMNLSLHFTSTDPVGGVISGEVSGSSGAIALLNELIVAGKVLTAPAMAVETRPLRPST